jgi:hypothetical protein
MNTMENMHYELGQKVPHTYLLREAVNALRLRVFHFTLEGLDYFSKSDAIVVGIEDGMTIRDFAHAGSSVARLMRALERADKSRNASEYSLTRTFVDLHSETVVKRVYGIALGQLAQK